MSYKSPIEDFKYNLAMLNYDEVIAGIEKFKEYDSETLMSVVSEIGRLNEQEVLDSNKIGDREGLKYVTDGAEGPEVHTPERFKKLYDAVKSSGYVGATMPTQYGGGGAPFTTAILAGEIGIAANMAFYMGPGLSHGAMKTILKKATEELKDKYLPNMTSGEWMGTMCLTEPQCGTMEAMFLMMNDARLKVGLQGIAMSEISYQNALEFAKERKQMRSVVKDKQDKDSKADNIIVHPDVRRMLMNVKATTEAMRALCIYTAMKIDLAEDHPDEKVRQEADDFAALMTPIIKAYCTDRGFLNCSESLQVLGGSGFTKEYPLEQYMRDVRITMIYEGTNGIQAGS